MFTFLLHCVYPSVKKKCGYACKAEGDADYIIHSTNCTQLQGLFSLIAGLWLQFFGDVVKVETFAENVESFYDVWLLRGARKSDKTCTLSGAMGSPEGCNGFYLEQVEMSCCFIFYIREEVHSGESQVLVMIMFFFSDGGNSTLC